MSKEIIKSAHKLEDKVSGLVKLLSNEQASMLKLLWGTEDLTSVDFTDADVIANAQSILNEITELNQVELFVLNSALVAFLAYVGRQEELGAGGTVDEFKLAVDAIVSELGLTLPTGVLTPNVDGTVTLAPASA